MSMSKEQPMPSAADVPKSCCCCTNITLPANKDCRPYVICLNMTLPYCIFSGNCGTKEHKKENNKYTVKGLYLLGDVKYGWIKSSDKNYNFVSAPSDVSSPGDLVDVWDFLTGNRLMDMTGKFYMSSLTANTTYQIVLTVLLKKGATGWRLPLKVKLPDGRDTTVRALSSLPKDTWETVVIGDFTATKDDRGEFKIFDDVTHQLKDGLLVKGFELRSE